MFVSSPDTYSSLNLTWHKVSKHLSGWHTAQCGKQAQLTLGHVRVTTDSKKYNTSQNQTVATTGSRFKMCHGRVTGGKKKKKKEGKAQEIEPRNMFMTDCTSVEEFPPRHCREVVQNYITGRRHLKRGTRWISVLRFPSLHCVWK